LNGYVAFIEGARHEVWAETLYGASLAARALYGGRKKYPSINVMLCVKDGAQVAHVPMD